MARSIIETDNFDDFICFSYLRLISEDNKNLKLLKDLKKEFPNELDYYESLYKLKYKDIYQKIFKILNENIFNNKIPEIEIKVDLFKNLNVYKNEIEKQYKIENHNNMQINDAGQVFSILLNSEEELSTINDANDIKILIKAVLINKQVIFNKNLGFLINTICHEMIHLYDILYGTYKEDLLKSIKENSVLNSHNTKTFKKYVKKANMLGLNVVEKYISEDEKNFKNIQLNSDGSLDHELYFSKDKKYISLTIY